MRMVATDSSDGPGRVSAGASAGCERFLERVQDSLDARSDLAELGRDLHPEGCPSCRETLAAFAALDASLGAEPATLPPPELATAVASLVRADAARARRRSRLLGLVAAAALVALGVGLSLAAGDLARGGES